MYPKIILAKGKEQSLLRRHPWVFSGAIKDLANAQNADWVEVYSYQNEFLGAGFYSANTSIAIRILSFKQIVLSPEFWVEKLIQALALRLQCGLLSSSNNMFRLVHGEGDGLSGLIIDIYGNHAVVQAHHDGIFSCISDIATALKSLPELKLQTIYCKSKATLHSADSEKDYFVLGNTAETIALENGHSFLVNWVNGQKTGFFLDQRPNRNLLGETVQHLIQNANNSNKEVSVLNTFAYSGGFSIYALQAGASLVRSVDISETAVALCEKNAEFYPELKQNHTAIAADVLKYLENCTEKFDIVVLDPPAFAKNMHKKHNAVMGYKRLNALGMKCVKPGGFLFTFSCSQVIDTVLFENTVVSAANQAGVEARIVHRLGQGPDHPVNVFHPEGHYLKGLVLYFSE